MNEWCYQSHDHAAKAAVQNSPYGIIIYFDFTAGKKQKAHLISADNTRLEPKVIGICY